MRNFIKANRFIYFWSRYNIWLFLALIVMLVLVACDSGNKSQQKADSNNIIAEAHQSAYDGVDTLSDAFYNELDSLEKNVDDVTEHYKIPEADQTLKNDLNAVGKELKELRNEVAETANETGEIAAQRFDKAQKKLMELTQRTEKLIEKAKNRLEEKEDTEKDNT